MFVWIRIDIIKFSYRNLQCYLYALNLPLGLGISIVSGRVEGSQAVSGIFIKNVLPDSPAGKTGKLFTGDRLVEVGGVQLTNADQVRSSLPFLN